MNRLALSTNPKNLNAEVPRLKMPLRSTTHTGYWEAGMLVGIELFFGAEGSDARHVGANARGRSSKLPSSAPTRRLTPSDFSWN